MPITLGSNIGSLRGQRQLSRTSAELGTVFQRLSSGQRINKASDDAAGLSIADSLNARSRIYNQGIRNLNDGQSLLAIADSAIENLSSIVIRLEELAEQAANGVYTNKQRKAMDDEAQALSKEFFRISKSTEFNGQRLLTGEFDAVNLQGGVGADAVLSAGIGGAIGTGGFQAYTAYTTAGTLDSRTADLNGDGALDIVSSGPGALYVQLNLGNGSFAAGVSYSANASCLNTGDFNGDGVIDVVATNFVGSVSILLGRGDGSFKGAVSYATGASPSDVTVGDFNGDGRADIATADYLTTTISVLLGAGDGTFGPRVSFEAFRPDGITSADVNGDGLVDIITGSRNGAGSVGILLGTGSGSFAPAVSYAATQSRAVAAADFNNDGSIDVVTVGNDVQVLMGLGNGALGPAVSYGSASDNYSVSAGDFNGDGYMDFAVSEYYSSTVGVYIGRGDGTFENRAGYGTYGDSWSVATGDVNGDGVTDLISAGADVYPAGEGGVSVLFGTSRDGVAPFLPFSLKTLADARQALPVFKRKHEQLAAQRGEIGAFQSRIDIARSVLEVSSENFKAAESRIRDADIADESSRLVRLNILQQAAASVLAQANQQPALALQLLRG